MKFNGYVRTDGQVGARNLVAVVPTVVCANDVTQAIVSQVQGTVGFFHHQGCCQLPPDLDRVTRTLAGLATGPNVGAVVLVSLGCEGTDAEAIAEAVTRAGRPLEVVKIQQAGGFSAALKAGVDAAQKMIIEISGQAREPVDMSQAIMSIKCGASDATSGLASNCVIGYVADRLVDMGATVIFGETTEFIGAEHILARRAKTPETADKIYEIVRQMETRAKSLGCDMRKGQPTPGNIAGGLSSIEEKSLGAIAKSGTKPIEGVLEYWERLEGRRGLWIKDTPGREPEILTGMACSGAQCMMFSTGRGAPQGFPSMPVLKICGNHHTYENMPNDMDLNAGVIITGEKNIAEVGEEALTLLIKVLNGQYTKNEAVRYFNFIDIHTLGPVI